VSRSAIWLAAAGLGIAVLAGYIGLVGTHGSLPPRSDGRPGASGPATPPTAARATPDPSSSPLVFPAAGKVFIGLQTQTGPYDMAPVAAFASATRYRPAVLQFTQGWAHDRFDASLLDRVVTDDMLPILAWEPWDYLARHNGVQPAYRLSRIIAGDFDSYVRDWATGIRNLGYPVGIRFAHEMNGFWYPWSESANGNRRGEYVKAFRHVHDIFTAAGADNVIWIWSPNVTYPGAQPLRRLYPGDKYVDWVGVSGYYGTAGMTTYRSFDDIFASTFKQLRRFTRRPIVVTETAATNKSGQQSRWIRQMFQQLPRHRDVIGIIWFEVNKEVDWRITTSPESVETFAHGAADKRYAVTWTRNTIPRSSTPRTTG
jgi:mannan endo-1,4-beta-mannosidase